MRNFGKTAVLACCLFSMLLGSEKKKLGLVLSGGGARGIAHIGVIKVLEEEGIRPDYITGTSMGSIVGGLYAIGYDYESLVRIVKEMDWELMFTDRIDRRNYAIEEKDDFEKYIASFPLVSGRISLPLGLMAGHNISNKLSDLTLPVHHIDDFTKLPIPFKCIGADIETGEAVVLDSGYLADAIRASMAVPSIFTPVEMNGHLLVDGGIARNFPVTDARAMGADLIIGVDVATPLANRENLRSAIQVMNQTAIFQGSASTLQQRKLCDLLIIPDLGELTSASFSAESVDSLIAMGEKSARKKLSEIRAIAAELRNGPEEEIRFIPTTQIDSLYVTELRFEGVENVSEELLKNKLKISPPSWITPEALRNAIDRTFASQYFERVNYRLDPVDGGGVILIIRVVEQSVNSLRVGIHYDDHMKSALLLNLTFRNLLFQGSKFSTDLVLGSSPQLISRFFIYTPWNRMPGLGADLYLRDIEAYNYSDGKRVEEYSIRYGMTALKLHSSPVENVEFQVGLRDEFALLKTIIGVSPDQAFNIPSLYASFRLDTYDRRYFPRTGTFISLFARRTSNDIAARFSDISYGSYNTFTFHADKATSLGPSTTLIRNVNVGYTDQETIPEIHKFYMGGTGSQSLSFVPMLGLYFMEESGSRLASFSMIFQNRLTRNNYLLITLNNGIATDKPMDLVKFGKYRYGMGLTYGYDSPVGPVYLTAGKSLDRSDILTHISIGYDL